MTRATLLMAADALQIEANAILSVHPDLSLYPVDAARCEHYRYLSRSLREMAETSEHGEREG